MTTTYKKTNSPTAIYGESSPAVLKLQQELNAKGAGLTLDSKYGPLTQAAFTKFNNQTTTPAPQPDRPITTPTITPARLERTATANQSYYDASKNALAAELEKGNQITPEQVEAKRQASQLLVDEIQKEFTKRFSDEEKAGEVRAQQTRAENISAGLGGSSFAGAAADKTAKVNEKEINALNAEKASRIDAVLRDVDTRYNEKYAEERKTRLSELGASMELRKKFIDEERGKSEKTIAGLAREGTTWEAYKQADPNGSKQVFDEFGGSEIDIENYWNSVLPPEMKTQWSKEVTLNENGKGVVVRYGYDPIKKTTVEQRIPTGQNYNDVVEGKTWELNDGSLVKEYPDGSIKRLTGAIKKDGSDSIDLSTGNKSKLLGAGLSQNAISALEKDINQYGLDSVLSSGNSGMTDPQKKAVREAYGVPEKISRAQLDKSITQKFAIDGDGKDSPGLRGTYTNKELKKLADEHGYSSFWTGKETDIERFLNSPEARSLYVDLLYEQYKSAGMAQ